MALQPVPMEDIPQDLVAVPATDLPEYTSVPVSEVPQNIQRKPFTPQPWETFGQYLKWQAQQTFAPAIWLFGWIGKVMEKTTGVVTDWAWKKLFGQTYYAPVAWLTEKVVPKILQWQEQWLWYRIWEIVWKQLPAAAAIGWLRWVSWSLFWRAVKGAWLGAVGTQAWTLLTEWRLATPKETLIGAWVGAFLGWAFWGKSTKALQKLVQPKLTPTVEAERAAQWLKRTWLLGKVKMLPTEQEKKMAQLWSSFLKPWKTVTYNVNKSLNVLNKETDDLINIVKDHPYTFKTSDIVSRMTKIEKQ